MSHYHVIYQNTPGPLRRPSGWGRKTHPALTEEFARLGEASLGLSERGAALWGQGLHLQSWGRVFHLLDIVGLSPSLAEEGKIKNATHRSR